MNKIQFGDLFSLSSLISLIAGMVIMATYCNVKESMSHHKHPGSPHRRQKWQTTIIGWTLIIFIIGYIGVETQEAHDATIDQAQETKALVYKIAWDEYFSGRERCALTQWLSIGMVPPQALFDKHTTDPEYQAWAKGVNENYLKKLNDIENKREAFAQKPPKNLPEDVKCNS